MNLFNFRPVSLLRSFFLAFHSLCLLLVLKAPSFVHVFFFDSNSSLNDIRTGTWESLRIMGTARRHMNMKTELTKSQKVKSAIRQSTIPLLLFWHKYFSWLYSWQFSMLSARQMCAHGVSNVYVGATGRMKQNKRKNQSALRSGILLLLASTEYDIQQTDARTKQQKLRFMAQCQREKSLLKTWLASDLFSLHAVLSDEQKIINLIPHFMYLYEWQAWCLLCL